MMPDSGRTDVAVIVDDVTFGYHQRPVLQNVSFEIDQGRLAILLGRNGSGKSTLIKIIAGLLSAVSGTIRVMGRELKVLRSAERAKTIGYLPQFHQPVFQYSVEDVVLTGRVAYIWNAPGHSDRQIAQRALQTVGIEHLRDRPYTELSGGERQLVMFARVLAQEPDIILLDEPVSHLDLANQIQLLTMLKRMTQAGCTVLAALHDPNIASRFGDQFIFLKNSRIASPPNREFPWDSDFLSSIYSVQLETIRSNGKPLIFPVLENTQLPPGPKGPPSIDLTPS